MMRPSDCFPAGRVPARPPPSADYVLEDQVGHLLRRAHQRHTALFASAFEASGLTPTQWAALAGLAATGAMTQNLLGRATAMDPATVQGVVRRLIARGLVGRAPDPADRRQVKLTLTPAGRSCYHQALECAVAVTEETLAPLAAAERQAFLALLRRLG